MTKLKATCGCQWTLETDAILLPNDVINAAHEHSNERNHTVIISGIIERPRAKVFEGRPTRHDHQRQS